MPTDLSYVKELELRPVFGLEQYCGGIYYAALTRGTCRSMGEAHLPPVNPLTGQENHWNDTHWKQGVFMRLLGVIRTLNVRAIVYPVDSEVLRNQVPILALQTEVQSLGLTEEQLVSGLGHKRKKDMLRQLRRQAKASDSPEYGWGHYGAAAHAMYGLLVPVRGSSGEPLVAKGDQVGKTQKAKGTP